MEDLIELVEKRRLLNIRRSTIVRRIQRIRKRETLDTLELLVQNRLLKEVSIQLSSLVEEMRIIREKYSVRFRFNMANHITSVRKIGTNEIILHTQYRDDYVKCSRN